YYKGIIEYILNHTNITIHYITSDPNDGIFELEKQNEHVKAYFIDEKRLITLMMKMDADVVAMTMPDLETYHIKRSYVRKDIEYVYIPHGMDSNNMAFRTKALNAFDTVYVCGPHQLEECEKIAGLYGLKDQKFIKYGYCLLDQMISDYEAAPRPENEVKTVLIAPSWQKDNIIDLCLDKVMESMRGKDYNVIVRPHPQHVRHMPEKFERLKEQYKDDKNITVQTDFSSNDTVFNADILITDWSSISQDYAFTTKKPVIFIDTPPKIMNPEYKRIDTEPINMWIRNEVGALVKLEELDKLDDIVREMLQNREKYHEKIAALTESCVYNLGKSSEVGGKYIIEAVQNQIKKRKENKS
ncbi:MAG: CDP-glycerol glycerophosphotransferase family protein, partial [Oscillospiraceae bacterium]|nr:CDP-glycerol glycerophosphotransferase family protein [Oscillospiraceae bacterium]